MKKDNPPIYGLMAEFDNPKDLVAAANRTREEGYKKIDAYSPMPVEGLAEALGSKRTLVPLICLCAGLSGGIGGFFFQWWICASYYPINIGGRPLLSWPSFIPITFELTVLVGSIIGLIGMLALNGLPRPHHPVFNVPRFALASEDRFFLAIESQDPKFDINETRHFLEVLGSLEVSDVEY